MKRKRINLLQENSDDEVEVLDVSITPKIIPLNTTVDHMTKWAFVFHLFKTVYFSTLNLCPKSCFL